MTDTTELHTAEDPRAAEAVPRKTGLALKRKIALHQLSLHRAEVPGCSGN